MLQKNGKSYIFILNLDSIVYVTHDYGKSVTSVDRLLISCVKVKTTGPDPGPLSYQRGLGNQSLTIKILPVSVGSRIPNRTMALDLTLRLSLDHPDFLHAALLQSAQL